MIITKSKIDTFKTCKFRFKLQYIDKLKVDVPLHPLTKRGIDLHKLFEKFFDNISLSVNYLPLSGNQVYDAFYNSMQVPNEYKEEFSKFCKSEASLYLKHKENYYPLYLENHIKHKDLYGIVDRINLEGNEFSLIDYKSSTNYMSKTRFELYFYKILIDNAKILPKPIKYVGVYGYNDGIYHLEPVTQKRIDLAQSKIDAFKETDFDNIQYPKTKGFHCQWCNYNKLCD